MCPSDRANLPLEGNHRDKWSCTCGSAPKQNLAPLCQRRFILFKKAIFGELPAPPIVTPHKRRFQDITKSLVRRSWSRAAASIQSMNKWLYLISNRVRANERVWIFSSPQSGKGRKRPRRRRWPSHPQGSACDRIGILLGCPRNRPAAYGFRERSRRFSIFKAATLTQ